MDEAHKAFQSGGGKHELQIDLDPNLPWIMADQLRMIQVLINLLSNAARHSSDTCLPIEGEGRLGKVSSL